MLRNANLAAVLMLLVACGLTPRQPILPYPDHIRSGVEVGDTLEILTNDGETVELIVTEVSNDAIVGEGQRVSFSDISALSKRSWKPARNPCDAGPPLGCSIPEVITALSDYHEEHGEKLGPSCAVHDYCYRYGLKTYGYSREACDTAFLENMKKQCSDEHKLDPVGLAKCLFAAKQMHWAVVKYGEDKFQGGASQYCEYAGPQVSPAATSGRLWPTNGDGLTGGVSDPTTDIHTAGTARYDEIVKERARVGIMSIEKTTAQKPAVTSNKGGVGVSPTVDGQQPVIESIEVAELQIDETFDGDFDPYNSTGQFLADALKKKFDE